MDAKIERKIRFSKKLISTVICLIVILVFLLWLIFRDTSSSMNVSENSITLSTVVKGEFNDYIRVIGQVVPDHVIYLDAIESGRVEERLIEEGAQVKAGDVIIRMSNSLLDIGILQSEVNLAYQENELRNTRLSMEQEHFRLKQERIILNNDLIQKTRRFEQYSRLYDKGLVSREDYLRAREDYNSVSEQMKVLDERIRRDVQLRDNQLQNLTENIQNIKKSLLLVRGRLENLKIKAPVDGQLGNMEAQIGQSISQGERIGQIITTELKVEAKIDEHYVERIHAGLPANFERDGKRYEMKMTKVYPEVQDGQFRTDFHFISDRPVNIRAGQTYHLDLQLGDPVHAIIIPRGIYQYSGGEYVYVVDEDGKEAHRRRVRLGRQNPLYYEVLDGLRPGETIITSGYELFGKNERLNLR
ncbi:MAG: HlyD family efflux transporter periplasmic adaptor subunit [Bacteroides sp.]|nr:HlyD family efflux transporter periplasmic adaptor subunit [Bacteroides sp.]MCM1447807.1 HlyD family efflux transporter periplasmic adaptor subunit [Bacteroides sp.]MCM1516901.1 HlyD family efflux transporter periplasmic adaptor subunit [Paraprevotella sp.]